MRPCCRRPWLSRATHTTMQDLISSLAEVNVIEYKVRDATGKLEETIWAVGKVFKSYRRWWKSGSDGAANAVDNVESQVRDIIGELQRSIREVNGALKSYTKWWRSSTGGAYKHGV